MIAITRLSGRKYARNRGRTRSWRSHLQTARRSEEHTSELQSRQYLVCRLLLEKKKWSRVSREPNATIAVRPGSEALRPGPETDRPNVVRPRAWTANGLPPTMEGAIRSGRDALQ